MNLQKMFEMQKVLDERIIKEKGLEGQDLLPNLILALQVELAECANEWRGFKHWSNDREPRTKIEHFCPTCEGTGDENHDINLQYLEEGHAAEPYSKCQDCNGSGKIGESNPLLEEYVDCLHFILSIGNRIGYSNKNTKKLEGGTLRSNLDVADQVGVFSDVFEAIAMVNEDISLSRLGPKAGYAILFRRFNSLGKMLGFTPDQIEAAYMDKNAVNHQRQQEGY
ncbi:dUTP diphosphatase [Bacillus subtilis]|uniref:dUTP diphosphatase n=1 Tax=Bacillus subtilis TaxID=1423 RepID=UPI0013748958|nr:dUTP diphosphatase [Bacillus subtilis]QHQ82002.1 dUTPase [Bacillus subtilis]